MNKVFIYTAEKSWFNECVKVKKHGRLLTLRQVLMLLFSLVLANELKMDIKNYSI